MKKRFLLLTLIMCLLGGVMPLNVMAQEEVVTIGNGGTDIRYAPFNEKNGAYSVSQQLYKKSLLENVPNNATITSISFFLRYDDKNTRNLSVYMKNTEDESNVVQSYSDADKVFSGEITTNENGDKLLTIPVSSFKYTGNGIYIYVNDQTGVINSSTYQTFYSFASSGGIRHNYSETAALDETALDDRTPINYLNNIQITYSSGSSTPTAPDAPALVSPENLATDIFNPALNFTLGNHTEHYQILMGEGTNEMTDVTGGWVEKTNNTVSYQTNNLKSNTAYTWKVVARCSDGGTGYLTTESEAASFTTRNVTEVPGTISVNTPANGAEVDSDPQLSWTFGENTESYKVLFAREGEDLFIAKDWTNTKNAEDETFNTSAIKLDGEYDDPGLDANTTYQWQIVTKNSVGETESEVFTFTKLGAPDNVTPISPTNGATGVSNDVILTWNFDATTTHYRVLFAEGNPGQLAYEAGDANNWLEVNGETGSFETTDQDLKPNTIYYWCVDVKNGAGQRTQHQGGESVQVFSFTTTDVFPATYNTPGNEALVGNTTADLTWSYGAGNTANEYQVLLGTDERDLDVVLDWTSRPSEGTGLVGSGSYTATELSPNTKYYWQVNTRKGTTTIFGAVWSFVTTLDVPQNVTATPENVYPGNTYPYNAVATVTWDAIANATYNVYVNSEKYNAEALTTNTCDVILPYNMVPGNSIQVSAIYPELGESEKSEAANVKVTGYVNVNGYVKDESGNAIEGATVTLVGTDEFDVEYDGIQIATTNEQGAYSGKVYAGTYNIVVEKDPYEDEISEQIDFEYNETVGHNVTLSADFIFTVSFKNVTADEISVYASNDNWTSPKAGYYNVYIKKGEDIVVDPKSAWFSAEGETAVYHSEVINEEWFNLENGTYQIGVEMYGKNHINWGTIEREYSIFTTEGDWSDEINWRGVPGTDADVYIYAPATIAEDDVVAVKNVTIQKDGSLTINGSLTADNVSNEFGFAKLCINDGGQLRQTKNAELSGRFVKSINAPTDWDATSNVDGWQFISAPVADRAISAFVPVDVDVDYDLFKFDGTKEGEEWVNHKQTQEEIEFETTFQQGRGYLASYQEEGTFTFSGELNNATTFDFALTAFDDEKEWSKFTLLGNPFTFNMNIANLVGTGMEAGVAVINETGNGYSYMTDGEVKVGEGFFVKANSGTAMLSYEEGTKRGEENVPSINLIATSKAGNDNVIIRFADEENEGFNKLDNFDDAIATVYVQDNGANYGIYNCDENTTEVELCFNANQMGNYTISVEDSEEFERVILVDRFTGIETNMLLEDYTFTAMSDVNNNRFILKLAVSDQQSAVSDNFVYQSGEELIVEAEGTVQIIDMMGRVVYNNDVTSDNNRINVSDFNNGAYVVRVINENEVKVQKIIL